MDDILKGKWKQMRGQAREWWGDITDDEWDEIGGKKDSLVGKLQEKYGWNKKEAETEVDNRILEYRKKHEAA
ncbi:MAG: CsbD family protein [Thermoleophilia bacterium]|nr:CsbD family protein [Thermoleophilia bacterium]